MDVLHWIASSLGLCVCLLGVFVALVVDGLKGAAVGAVGVALVYFGLEPSWKIFSMPIADHVVLMLWAVLFGLAIFSVFRWGSK